MPAQQRRAIIVLGMHRSGTSAVAGAVNLLGAERPVSMLLGGPSNPLGYFEAYGVIHVNDWILRMAGCTWYDCLGFSPDALDETRRRTAMALINICVDAEFGEVPLLLLKDPQLCLLLDYWLPMLDAMQIEPIVLLVLRHPAEVVASLARRDTFPEPLAAATWLHHALAAEHATRGRRRALVAYDELMRDWRGCLVHASEQAGIAWPFAFDAVAEQMELRLPETLRHHQLNAMRCDVPQAIRVLMQPAHDTLLALTHGDAPSHLYHLDELRGDLTSWRLQYGRSFAHELLDGHVLRSLPPEVIPADWMQLAEGLAQSAV